MSNIELVIKISKEDYERLKEYKKAPFCSLTSRTYEAIANGVPLPKGHGRLIDADALDIPVDICDGFEAMDYIDGADAIIEADKENPLDEYIPMVEEMKQMMQGDYLWNCKECEHTEDECKDCYPELGYKNNKRKRDTEAVSEFVKSDAFKELMESLDKQDRAATQDAVDFLRDIEAEDGRKAGHLEGCRDEYEAMASYLRSVLEELRP